MSNGAPTFQVEEHLYLAAMFYLGGLESRLGEDIDPFDLSYAGHGFVASARALDAFESAAGRPISSEERELSDRFFMGLQAPMHYNQSLEQYTDGIYDIDPRAASALRDVVFAFVTAWGHRYGGMSPCRVVNGVVRSLGQD